MKSNFSTVVLTGLMLASTASVAAMNQRNGDSRLLTDVVIGGVVGSVAKLAGNTAYDQGNFSMKASLASAAAVGAIATGAAYKYDSNANLLAVIAAAVSTYCAWTKTFFPHKKNHVTTIVMPELPATRKLYTSQDSV